MKEKLRFTIVVCILFIGSNDLFGQVIERVRPMETWVFRSVLDKKPRMVTLALNKDLWAAYDANNCSFVKAWKGDVELLGPVYNYDHGPQPRMVGKKYAEGANSDTVWHVLKNGKSILTKVNFKGYTWDNNQIIFNYEIETEDGKKIIVRETPEFIRQQKSNFPGLQRIFTTENVPAGYEVLLDLKAESLPKEKYFTTNGVFIKRIMAERYYDWGKTIMMEGTLKLNLNATTSVLTYFSPKVVQ